MTGHVMATSINDVAVRAPDGSIGHIDSLRRDQLAQQGIAPGFENMQIPVPANENANPIAASRQDNGRDESQREYGPPGQHKAGGDEHVNQKDMLQKPGELAAEEDDYGADDKDIENDAQHPVDVSSCYKFDITHKIVISKDNGSFFYRAMLCYMPSSCVYVSVTLRYCIKTAKHRITKIKPHDSAETLVF